MQISTRIWIHLPQYVYDCIELRSSGDYSPRHTSPRGSAGSCSFGVVFVGNICCVEGNRECNVTPFNRVLD